VVAKERIRQFLTDINRARGVTVILTTHDLEDITRLCQRVVLIDHGHVIYDSGLETLRTRFGRQRTLVVDLDGASDDEPAAPAMRIANAEVVRREGPRVWLRFDRQATTAAALIADVAARYRIRDLTVEEPPIEGIVRGIYENGSVGSRAGLSGGQ
jgi:ABC-2 type transport system ATP-binding protein